MPSEQPQVCIKDREGDTLQVDSIEGDLFLTIQGKRTGEREVQLDRQAVLDLVEVCQRHLALTRETPAQGFKRGYNSL